MTQSHPTSAVAATKLPKERLAQLDRLARRRRVSRSSLIREMIEQLVEEADEPLTQTEQAEVERRRRETDAVRRLGELNERLRRRLDNRATDG